MAGDPPKMTRRALVTAGVGAAVLVYWGRFAVGGTFEGHISQVLGIERPLTDELLRSLRDELSADYDVRAAAFVAATTAPTRWLMPEGARREALESFVGPLFGLQQGFVTPFAYAGLRDSGTFAGCSGLIRT